MPRKKFLRSDVYPYHVTGRANNREMFPIPLPILWTMFGSEFHLLRVLFDIEVQAFVLMPNHYHLIVTTPLSNLDQVMNYLSSDITRAVNAISGRTGHLFGGPYHWTSIQSGRYFSHALKYVYRNPVKAGLSSQVEDYEFSTYSGLLGNCHLPMPILYTRLGMEMYLPSTNPISWLEWLNRPFLGDAEDLIRKGLRRSVFKTMINQKTKRPFPILEVRA